MFWGFFPPLSHLKPFCELPDVRQDWGCTAGEMLVFCETDMRMGALESVLKGVREAKILPFSPLFVDLFCGKEIKQKLLLLLLFNQCFLSPACQQSSLTGRRAEAHRKDRCLNQLPPTPSFPVGVLKSFWISHSQLWGTFHKHTASRQFVDMLGQLKQISGRRSPCMVWFPTWGCMASWNITSEGLGRLFLLVDGRNSHSTWSLANAGVQIYLVTWSIFQQPLCMTAKGTSWENIASRKNQAW